MDENNTIRTLILPICPICGQNAYNVILGKTDMKMCVNCFAERIKQFQIVDDRSTSNGVWFDSSFMGPGGDN
jgi:hypothetical protein